MGKDNHSAERQEFDGKAFAKRLSTRPGVYLMRDTNANPLYVGKAKSLRKRVSSYFDARPKNDRISRMIRQISSIDVSLTRTEGEALLLENEWIKSLKPRYNILLRDDKSYPYLRITSRDRYPRVTFHRGSQNKGDAYFGPYPSAGSVRESINLIQKLFQIRNCEDSIFQHRSRPCLQHQIHRCTAPCVGQVTTAEYGQQVENAILFLQGRNEQVAERLVNAMQAAAETQQYEAAAAYRDQIQLLREIQAKQFVSGNAGDVDVVAVAMREDQAAVQVVSIRGGRNLGQRTFFPDHGKGESNTDIMAAFLGQYYRNKQAPKRILLSHKPEELALYQTVFSEQAGRRVALISHPRGEQAQWLKLAAGNAANALALKQAQHRQIEGKYEALAELLQLDQPPQRVECFDISHISGQQTMGSCVVFDQKGPVKSQYRRFSLKNITPGDDYAAMRQVLLRRYKRQVQEEGQLPDLIIIDGGKGQLKQAVEVLAELGQAHLPLLAIAKGPTRRAGYEEWLLPVPPYSLRPRPDDPASHLLQQIRDEAHRFAISGHRARRQKAANRSSLEEIPGIGPKRRRQLLRHFGGFAGLQKAGVEELLQAPGINRHLAKLIYDYLH